MITFERITDSRSPHYQYMEQLLVASFQQTNTALWKKNGNIPTQKRSFITTLY